MILSPRGLIHEVREICKDLITKHARVKVEVEIAEGEDKDNQVEVVSIRETGTTELSRHI